MSRRRVPILSPSGHHGPGLWCRSLECDGAALSVSDGRDLGAGVPAWLSYSVAGERTRAGQSLSEAFAVATGVPEVVAVPLFRRAVDGGGGENRGRMRPSPAR